MRTCSHKIFLLTAILFLSVQLMSSSAKAVGEYLLGARDKIFIRIVEWRPSVDKIHAWEALNREYIVRTNGTIRVPLIGSVQALGLNTDELATKISQLLKKQMNLVVRPDATVEVVQFRPFYILGLAEKPGEYAFRPGMTVLQALSISGGTRRSTSVDSSAQERAQIQTKGRVSAFFREINLLEIRKYKLQSQLEEKKKIRYPARVERDLRRAGYDKFLARAQVSFSLRRVGWQKKLSGAKKKKKLVIKEVAALEKQLKLKKREFKLISIERKKIRSLVRRKLMNTRQLFRLEQLFTSVQAGVSAVKVRQIAATNKLLSLTQGIEELKNEQMKVVAEELEKVEGDLREKAEGLRVEEILHRNIVSNMDPASSGSASTHEVAPLMYKIVRSSKGLSTEFDVTGDFLVQPGDVIKILRQIGRGVIKTVRPSADTQ